MNYILCPHCFAKSPIREEKCCSHGNMPATCSGCGVEKDKQGAHWHCLGRRDEVEKHLATLHQSVDPEK